MDYKVADLRKKLNKLKYETSLKMDRITHLMKDYEKVVNLNAEMEKAEEILEDSPEGQRLRFLENEIHKTNLKLMEGETIKKKYMTILDMLKKERLTFGNQIEGLEAQLRKQEEEIDKLKVNSILHNDANLPYRVENQFSKKSEQTLIRISALKISSTYFHKHKNFEFSR